jgi:hypothetical protein
MRPACPHTFSLRWQSLPIYRDFAAAQDAIRAKNESSETNLNHLKKDTY